MKQSEYLERVLSVATEHDFMSSIMSYKEDSETRLCIICNDFFGYACADSVLIEPEDVTLLEDTAKELEALEMTSGEITTSYIPDLFCVRKRKAMPISQVYNSFPQPIRELVDEATGNVSPVTLKDFYRENMRDIGKLFICINEVVRLLDIIEEGGEFLWVLQKVDRREKIEPTSTAIKLIPLDALGDDELNTLSAWMDMNSYIKINEFISMDSILEEQGFYELTFEHIDEEDNEDAVWAGYKNLVCIKFKTEEEARKYSDLVEKVDMTDEKCFFRNFANEKIRHSLNEYQNALYKEVEKMYPRATVGWRQSFANELVQNAEKRMSWVVDELKGICFDNSMIAQLIPFLMVRDGSQ